MTTYFIGDELECYSTYTIGVTESTDGNISGYSRGCIYIGDSDYVDVPLTNSVTGAPTATNDTLWLHMRRRTGNGNGNKTPTVWYDNAGVAKVRENVISQFSDGIQMWDGTQWVQVITGWNPGYGNFQVWDVRIKIATEGVIELFLEGVLVNRFSGDTTSIGNIAKVRMSNRGDFHGIHQVILADYSTINHTIRRRSPIGNGANTAWTGDYTQVDDAPSSTIGTDVITVAASETKETFTGTVLDPTTGGHVIKAVAVAEFSKNDATGQSPQNLKQILRVNGVDYEAPGLAPIGSGWTGGVAFWENNPATGAAWANIADVNATEFGVISKD